MSLRKIVNILYLFVTAVYANSVYDNKNANATRFQNEILQTSEPMQRITQPLEETRVTQQVANATVNHQQKSNSSFEEFKPSPQVGTYYEYNKFPVAPALPEAKFFSGSIVNDKQQAERRPWLDKPTVLKVPSVLPPWNNKISFPTTQSSYLPQGNQPYPYVVESNFQDTTTSRNQYSYIPETGQTESKNPYSYSMTGVSFETTTRNSNHHNHPSYNQFGSMTGYESTTTSPNYNSFMSYTRFGVTPSGNSGPGISNKYGDIFGQKGSFYGSPTGMEVTHPGENPYIHKTHYDHPPALIPYEGQMQSPWKKVIKFLSAIIPIGILLSALTPTIINVSPMNTTLSRGRAVDSNLSTKKLVYSLNHINKLNAAGCEEKVICELLLGAGSSKNSKKYAEELINTFTKQNNQEQLDELKVIFDAVQTGTCKSLNCTSIEEEGELDEVEEASLENL